MQIWQQLIHAAAVLSLRYEAQGKFREEERCAGATVVVTSSWEKKMSGKHFVLYRNILIIGLAS